MKKYIKFLIAIIAFGLCTPFAYAIYKSVITVSVTEKSGAITYDFIVDSQTEEYIEDKTPYFYITITNFKENKLTNADFDYKIIIKNKENNNGKFKSVDEDNHVIDFNNTITIEGVLNNDNKTSKKYKIYVSSDQMNETTVDYNIDYFVTQKNMDVS